MLHSEPTRPERLFGELLTTGVYAIRAHEDKPIQTIQDELGYALGKETGGVSIEYWRKGHIPTELSDVEGLAREIVGRGKLDKEWLKRFLRYADYPDPMDLCNELFPVNEVPPDSDEEQDGDEPKPIRQYVVAIVLLVAGVAVAAIIIFKPPPPCQLRSFRSPIFGPAINDLEVEITSPKHCSTDLPSGEHIPIEGTYSGNLAGREIWVLVYASDRKYYPQSADACLMLPAEASRGRWETTLFDRTTEQLDIVVTVTNVGSEASQVFRAWLKSVCDDDTPDIPGIPVSELPDGLVEMCAITVATK